MQGREQKRARNVGLVKLVGVLGITGALVLPIGIIPRIGQMDKVSNHNKVSKQESTSHIVSVVNPIKADKARTIKLPGTLEPIRETGIHARANGYVSYWKKDIGDSVKKGEILAVLETPEIDDSIREAEAKVFQEKAVIAQTFARLQRNKASLTQAQARLKESKAQLNVKVSEEDFAKTTNKRFQWLAKEGAVPRQTADSKERDYKTSVASRVAAQDNIQANEALITAARASIEAEKANLEAAKASAKAAQARLSNLRTQKSFQSITAPFDGVVTERNIEAGSLVTSGSESSKQVLYRIAALDTVRVFIDAPQYVAPDVKRGQNVIVKIGEFPSMEFQGKVVRTSVALDQRARTLKTEVHIPNQKRLLAAGMYADVNLKTERRQDTFLIPSTAVITKGNGPEVAMVDDEGEIYFTAVSLGKDFGEQTEIVSGVKSSDKVVDKPSDRLRQGELVKVAKSANKHQTS